MTMMSAPVMCLVCLLDAAQAQAAEINGQFGELSGTVSGYLGALMLGAGVITLVAMTVKIIQGEQDSVKSFYKWLYGFVGGAVVFNVVKGGISVAGYGEAGMGSMVSDLISLARTCIAIGAGSMLIIVVFKVLKGDGQSAKGFMYWLVGLSVGLILLSALRYVKLG